MNLSIKSKDSIETKSITINGNLVANGDNVISYIQESGGNLGTLTIKGEIIANGKNAQKEKID